MVIHFICRGNTHRSRLAEAYAKSLTQHANGIRVLSSGIEADRDLNGPIMPFVKLELERDGLLHLTGTTWTQTTQSLIDESDLLVFMNTDVHDDAVTRFRIPSVRSHTWHIPDVQGVDGQIREAVRSFVSKLEVARAD
jgi:protein-tyrosine-phosphatase